MIDLKRESMGEFIGNARSEIESLWNELMMGEDERADFAAFVDGRYLVTIFCSGIKFTLPEQMNTLKICCVNTNTKLRGSKQRSDSRRLYWRLSRNTWTYVKSRRSWSVPLETKRDSSVEEAAEIQADY